MRIGTYSVATLILLDLLLIMMITSLSPSNPLALPYFTLLVIVIVIDHIIALYGRYLFPFIKKKVFRSKETGFIGSIAIKDKYCIISGADIPKGRYAGFSVFKVIPLKPSPDLPEKAKAKLLETMETLVVSLPEICNYGVIKAPPYDIERAKRKIEAEISKLRARMSTFGDKTGKYARQIEALEKEKERLEKFRPQKSIGYIQVFAYGYSEEEVMEKLNELIARVEASFPPTLQLKVKLLKDYDLHDFIHLLGLGSAFQEGRV